MAITPEGFQKLREHAIDGSGVYRQAVFGVLRDFGTPKTEAEWGNVKDIVRRDLGGIRGIKIDEKLLDMAISEQKEHLRIGD